MPKRVPLPPTLSTFTVAQGRAAGLGEKRMMGADLERTFHGSRSTAKIAAATTAVQGILHACAAYRPLLTDGQFFSHTTAAALWSCPLPAEFETPLPIHVSTLAPSRAPRRSAVVGHQVAAGRMTVTRRYGYPVSDPLTLFCQLAPMLALNDLVAVADHLVLEPVVPDRHDPRPYIGLEALREGMSGFTGRGCRAAASAALLARSGAESRRETLLRLLLGRAGLPEPEVNPDIHDDHGRWLARADLVYRQWKVIAEYDGDHHRTDRAQYERDLVRIERLQDAGWIVVRIRARGLTAARAETVARVERALVSRGWRP